MTATYSRFNGYYSFDFDWSDDLILYIFRQNQDNQKNDSNSNALPRLNVCVHCGKATHEHGTRTTCSVAHALLKFTATAFASQQHNNISRFASIVYSHDDLNIEFYFYILIFRNIVFNLLFMIKQWLHRLSSDKDDFIALEKYTQRSTCDNNNVLRFPISNSKLLLYFLF